MEMSIFLAKFFAWLYLVLGIVMIIKVKFVKGLMKDMRKSSTFVFISGMAAFTFSLILLLLHNVWTADWTLILTILFVLGILKGLVRMLWPTCAKKSWKKFESTTVLTMMSVAIIIVGLVLGYFAYFA